MKFTYNAGLEADGSSEPVFSVTSEFVTVPSDPPVVPPLSVLPTLMERGGSSFLAGAIVSLILLEVSITSVAFSRVLLLGMGFLLGCWAAKAKAEKKANIIMLLFSTVILYS